MNTQGVLTYFVDLDTGRRDGVQGRSPACEISTTALEIHEFQFKIES